MHVVKDIRELNIFNSIIDKTALHESPVRQAYWSSKINTVHHAMEIRIMTASVV